MDRSTEDSKGPLPAIWVSLALLVCFSALFMTFKSESLEAVDGAGRAFGVLDRDTPTIHGNNHMLFEVNLDAFHKMVGVFAEDPKTRMDFYKRSSLLNSLTGAAAIVLAFLIGLELMGNLRAALFGSLLTGLSISFSLHATNPNEPMPGIFLSCLALYLCLRSNWLLIVLAGGFFAYSMACYQSMAAFGPAAAIALFWPKDGQSLRFSNTLKPALLLTSFLLFTVLIYTWAYSQFLGISNLSEAAERFKEMHGKGDKGIWGAPTLADLVRIVHSWPTQVFALPFSGFRETYLVAEDSKLELLKYLVLAGTTYGLMALGFVYFWSEIKMRAAGALRNFAIICSMIFIPLLAAFYWDPHYNKLWIQPSIGLLMLSSAWVDSNRIKIPWKTYYIPAFAVLLLIWNLKEKIIPNAIGNDELVSTLEIWDQSIPEDAAVIVEWNKEGIYFSRLFPAKRDFFYLSSEAVYSSEKEVITSIHSKHDDPNKKLYFIGLLHLDEREWEPFLGDQLQLRYESFEPFRKNAERVSESSENPLFHVILDDK